VSGIKSQSKQNANFISDTESVSTTTAHQQSARCRLTVAGN